MPAPSSKEYSSFQLPLLTEPIIGVGLVISAPSANPVKLTTGGGGGGIAAVLTVIVTCDVDCNCPSLARSCTIYTPAALKVTCVTSALGLLNATGAGPLIWLQAVVNVLPVGKPSSVAEPFRVIVFCGN